MQNTNKIDELLSKSLDDIENLVKSHQEDALSKGLGQDPNPEDVSEDAPEEAPEEGTEDGQEPEEGQEQEDDQAEAPDDADTDSDTEQEENTEEDEEVEKSLYNQLSGDNENIRKSLEVSEYLDALTKGISSILEGHSGNIQKSLESTESNQMLLAKSFQGIIETQRIVLGSTSELSKSVAAMSNTVNALASRLEVAEKTPLVRKSVASTSVKPLEKSFANTQQTATPANAGSDMNKSVALQKLTAEAEKGNSAYNSDILALESTSNLNVLSSDARKFLGL